MSDSNAPETCKQFLEKIRGEGGATRWCKHEDIQPWQQDLLSWQRNYRQKNHYILNLQHLWNDSLWIVILPRCAFAWVEASKPQHDCDTGFSLCSPQKMQKGSVNYCVWCAQDTQRKTQKPTRAHAHTLVKEKEKRGIYLYFLNLDNSQIQWPRAWDTRSFWFRVGRQNPPSSHETPFTTSGEPRST